MRMYERVAGDVIVLTLKGNLMGYQEVDEFQNRMQNLKGDGFNKVVVDLGGVSRINSDGIGMLISGRKSLLEVNGAMKLANLSERADYMLLVISRLNAVFDIFETTDRAVASFSMALTEA